MSAIIPFDFSAPVTTPSRRRERNLNIDVISHSAGFPTISIKGKVFAIVKGDERQPLMRKIDDDVVPVASLQLVVVRANSRSRVFYAKSYTEGDSDGAKPTCFSHDGLSPDAQSEAPQAKNCQMCPHSQWGSKVSTDGQNAKGTACTVNTRLAVAVPGELTSSETPTLYLLRVPAGSRANFSDAVKAAEKAGKDYNEIVMKVSFDPEAPSPKLLFKPVGLLADAAYEVANRLFDDEAAVDIVGRVTLRQVEQVQETPALPPAPAPVALPPAPAPAAKAPAPAALLSAEDLDDAPAPAPAPAARKRTSAPAPAPAPAPAATTSAASLLGDLSSMLGMTDD